MGERKLTKAVAGQIRKLYENGAGSLKIAMLYDITEAYVMEIVLMKKWKPKNGEGRGPGWYVRRWRDANLPT